MPFVSGEDWNRIQAHNAHMSEELRRWEDLGPFFDIAQELQDKVIELLDTPASAADIGRLAYESVLASQAEKARSELVAKYEQEHRRTLYGQVLTEVEAQEGLSIMETVVT
ncbi:MAG: hypothetical protein AAB834_00740, partial [Patescibacteria group bacterium]